MGWAVRATSQTHAVTALLSLPFTLISPIHFGFDGPSGAGVVGNKRVSLVLGQALTLLALPAKPSLASDGETILLSYFNKEKLENTNSETLQQENQTYL